MVNVKRTHCEADLTAAVSRNQIGRAETLRKAVVDRLEADDGIGGSALIAEQAGQARRSTQLPRQTILPARPVQRLPKKVLYSFSRLRACSAIAKVRL